VGCAGGADEGPAASKPRENPAFDAAGARRRFGRRSRPLLRACNGRATGRWWKGDID